MSPDTWIWLALGAAVVTMLAIDLVLFDRSGRASMREAVGWSVGWFAVGLGVTGLVWWWSGPGAGGEYLAGYLIEQQPLDRQRLRLRRHLQRFAVPGPSSSRVLFWGIFGALVLRVIFIFAGIAMLERFAWIAYVLGHPPDRHRRCGWPATAAAERIPSRTRCSAR